MLSLSNDYKNNTIVDYNILNNNDNINDEKRSLEIDDGSNLNDVENQIIKIRKQTERNIILQQFKKDLQQHNNYNKHQISVNNPTSYLQEQKKIFLIIKSY